MTHTTTIPEFIDTLWTLADAEYDVPRDRHRAPVGRAVFDLPSLRRSLRRRIR